MTEKNNENLPVEKEKQDLEFDRVYRLAAMYSQSDLVPEIYRGKDKKQIANCMIALQMADRIGADHLMVMQNLNIINGRPSWSSSFIISALNTCGKFSPLRFKIFGEGLKRNCIAWAHDRVTNDILEGPAVSMEMAKSEGWLDKKGSKWKTMPDLMLRYRAAAFFGRLYAPEILNGMRTVEENVDIGENENDNFDGVTIEAETVQNPGSSPQDVINKMDDQEQNKTAKTKFTGKDGKFDF